MRMAVRLDAAPFMNQNAFCINDEGTALDTAHLLAVHIFHFHHVEQATGQFFGIGQ